VRIGFLKHVDRKEESHLWKEEREGGRGGGRESGRERTGHISGEDDFLGERGGRRAEDERLLGATEGTVQGEDPEGWREEGRKGGREGGRAVRREQGR
jgi:hypothetical protein